MTVRKLQVIVIMAAEKNRLRSAVRPGIEAQIAWLEHEISDIGEELRQTLRNSPVWREKDDILRSVPRLGEQLSISLLAQLPELGRLNRRACCRSGVVRRLSAKSCRWERWLPAVSTPSPGTPTSDS